MSNTVIGLAGPLASGKTTIARYLSRQLGFIHLKSRDVLADALRASGEPVNERLLQDYGARIIEERGQHAVCELLMKDYDPRRNYVIDSLRHSSNCSYFRNLCGDSFKLLYVIVPSDSQLARFTERPGRMDASVTMASRIGHEVENDVPNLMPEADAVILNRDIAAVVTQVTALVLGWSLGRPAMSLHEMINAIADAGDQESNSKEGSLNHARASQNEMAEEYAEKMLGLLSECARFNIDIESGFWIKLRSMTEEKASLAPGCASSDKEGLQNEKHMYGLIDVRSLISPNSEPTG